MKKLLLSNQYGAWVMALMPFLYGMWLAPFVWQSCFLLAGWVVLFLAVYPFLLLFKGKNLQLYAKWTIIYITLSVLLFLPAFLYNWKILYFGIATLPFILINIYYVITQNERALNNDLAGITIFAIIGTGAYYFTAQQCDIQFLQVAIYPTLMLIGIVFYVKSMLRERKNKAYLYASYIIHSLILLYFFNQAWLLSIGFLPAFLRSFILPKLKITTKQIGLLEFPISFWFLSFLFAY